MTEFTCDGCKRTFEKQNDAEWNEFKAAEEMLTLDPESKNDPTDMLCDDCYEKFKYWYSSLTDAEKKKMRFDLMKKYNCL